MELTTVTERKGKSRRLDSESRYTEYTQPSNTRGALESHAHKGAKKRKSMETCLLNLKRRTDFYIYDLYLSYTNMHI